MPSEYDPLTVLHRVLALEQKQEYQDRAAVGGLTKFARLQLARARAPDADTIEAISVVLSHYSEADRDGRQRSIASALGLLNKSASVPSRPPHLSSEFQANVRALDTLAPVAPSPSRNISPARPSGHSVRRHPEDLDAGIQAIKGIGKLAEETFSRLGIHTVRDLLWYFPRTHYDYTDMRSISRMRLGQKLTIVGTLTSVRNNRTRSKAVITTATLSDDTGTVAVRWFNQPYLLKSLPVGRRVAITGEPDIFNGSVVFVPRDYEVIDDETLTHAARLVPIYPLTKGLYQKSLRQLIHRTLDEYSSALIDFLPAGIREKLDLQSLTDAVREYHFPADENVKNAAQRRLAFDELLLVQLGLLRRKQLWQQPQEGVAVCTDPELLDEFRQSLSFSLTGAQQRVLQEILRDMARPVPMSRLLQGDVGSGKTVVAAAALAQIVAAGQQGVLMAPTEILAEQHHRTIQALLEPFGVTCALLVGSTPRGQRKTLYQSVQEGSIDVLVGTHALIQEALEFSNLGLAITDEQHRFGVEQRALLRYKGARPHTLAMTATPIPRTLALTIYGDLDVSSLDQMPPGRVPVSTEWARTPAEAYRVVREEVAKGKQAFVICPVIEESKESDMRSVLAEYGELQRLIFPDLRVGLLHGRMKPKEKEQALDTFRHGEFDVLVATSVVEVGIDVPNATVMVIRDAHRFGLAQLHQFRGRVGRGGDQAICILLSSVEGETARDRLGALMATDDGFKLAEEDLRLRGPGEFWGLRQSGLPELRVAQLGDTDTIELARRAATQILDEDPELRGVDHAALRQQVQRFWAETADFS